MAGPTGPDLVRTGGTQRRATAVYVLNVLVQCVGTIVHCLSATLYGAVKVTDLQRGMLLAAGQM